MCEIEEDDDVAVYNWCRCVYKDNDTYKHMVGLL